MKNKGSYRSFGSIPIVEEDEEEEGEDEDEDEEDANDEAIGWSPFTLVG